MVIHSKEVPMTLEMKVRKAMDAFDGQMAALKKEYRHRFDSLPVNDFGETLADDVLAVNAWYENESKKIHDAFAQAILSI